MGFPVVRCGPPLPAGTGAEGPERRRGRGQPAEVLQVFHLARRGEELFGAPPDMEWTFVGGQLLALQSRPINTAARGQEEEQCLWYLSLRRRFGNLKALRRKVEGALLPAMDWEADRLAPIDLSAPADPELQEEIVLRSKSYRE